jgi:hypothetical protein
MSYGQQLNIFRDQAQRHGPHWRGIVLVGKYDTIRAAMEDAEQFLGVKARRSSLSMLLGNGARLEFRVCNTMNEAIHALGGKSLTHIIWLHRPDDEKVRLYARAQLRSKIVPMCDLRYEYAKVYP